MTISSTTRQVLTGTLLALFSLLPVTESSAADPRDGLLAQRDVRALSPDVTISLTTTEFGANEGSLQAAATALRDAAQQDLDQVHLIDARELSGTISFAETIEIVQTTIIEGPSDGQLILDGGSTHRAFTIADGATLVLRDLTLANFRHTGADGFSGSGGSAGYGGAIVVELGGHCHCERVLFAANEARGGAGSVALRGGLGGRGGRGRGGQPAVDGERVELGGVFGGIGGTAGRYRVEDPDGYAEDGGDGVGGGKAIPGREFGDGGRGGRPGGGGGGGAEEHQIPGVGGRGGKGGDGGTGGDGNFGGGGGAGGSGGGGGGGGDDSIDTNGPEPGPGGTEGAAGLAGVGGFGAGDGSDGVPGNPGRRGTFDSGNGGYGGGDPRANAGPAVSAPLGGGGGGAALGAAIFVADCATLTLEGVEFVGNHTRGGARGAAAAQDGRAIGSAVFLMPEAILSGAPRASFKDNTATAPDGTTPDAWTNPIAQPDATQTGEVTESYGLILDEVTSIAGGAHPAVNAPLYYEDALAANRDPATAVFRYKWSLWARNVTNGGVVEHQFLVRPEVSNLVDPGNADPDAAGLFSAQDRAVAASARSEAAGLFANDPSDPAVRTLLFDICYDSAAALGFLASFQANQAERNGNNTAALLQSTLDQHIEAYTGPGGVLETYREALACYAGILGDAQQFAAFSEDLPVRHFEALTYLDGSDGNLLPVPRRTIPQAEDSRDGYRDLTLVFDLLTAHGEAGVRLSELYLAREGAGDRETGRRQAASIERYLLNNGQLFLALLPDSPNPALAAAVGRWEEAINSLSDIQTRLASAVNALGFNDNFLLLASSQAYRDTFDYLRNEVLPPLLDTAGNDLAGAVGALDTYRATRDDFASRRDDLLQAILQRLAEIDPDDEPQGSDIYPDNTPGEIDEQLLRIEDAKTEIELNRTEVTNLHAEIRIAIETNEAVKEANLTIADIQVKYIDKQRSLDREIAELEAHQATADRAVAFLDVTSYSGAVVGAANMAFQGWADQQKIKIADRKAELAGSEVAEIVDAQNVLEDARLDGFIKTRLLDLKRLALESLLATNALTQEHNRLAALFAEKASLKRKLASLDASLATRYFADPIHQLRVQDGAGRAGISFRRAQLWIFALIRALEYKWNQPFVRPDGSLMISDLFSARNARDLDDLVSAIDDFNGQRFLDFDGGINTPDPTRISFRDDLMGGMSIEDFRTFLAELRDRSDENSFEGEVVLPFHTVRSIPQSSFFRGVLYSERPAGSGNYEPRIKGYSLDKINWVKVVVRGNFAGAYPAPRNQLILTELTYGGTSYLRNITVGSLDPDNINRVVDEMVPYETRSYDLSSGIFPPPESRNFLEDTVSAMVLDTSLVPELEGQAAAATAEDNFASYRFADRSVAATDWSLKLVIDNGFDAEFPVERIDDIELVVSHRNYDRDRR